ncbi:MAG: ABC transporter ATP-binding protein [Capsulimonadaceae bacterium]|nr:ABC transporter ATP-binding protein [Capsulimonadaceae bacterium]
MSTDAAIDIQDLRKEYGATLPGRTRFVAVDDLSLTVPRGQVFGFLGPNGAGKTTTINMLLGNVFPTSGGAKILGVPVGDRKVRARIGFLPEKFQFHDYLTAEEFLDLHGRLYGMPRALRRKRAHEALDRVGLLARRRSRLREFSKGMQQRVGLAQAILNEPDLVILDEPTSALDPIGRRAVRDLIHSLKESGTTVFLNSHLLSEIEMTCDEVAIIKAGKVVRQGSIDDLLADHTAVEIRVDDYTPAVRDAIAGLSVAVSLGDGLVTATLADGRDVPDIAAAVVAAGGRLRELTTRRDSLEELFIRVVEEE